MQQFPMTILQFVSHKQVQAIQAASLDSNRIQATYIISNLN